MRCVTLMLPADVLFNGTPEEWPYFESGWLFRVVHGKMQSAPPGREYQPEATQDERVSWERGWMAANAVLDLLTTE